MNMSRFKIITMNCINSITCENVALWCQQREVKDIVSLPPSSPPSSCCDSLMCSTGSNTTSIDFGQWCKIDLTLYIQPLRQHISFERMDNGTPFFRFFFSIDFEYQVNDFSYQLWQKVLSSQQHFWCGHFAETRLSVNCLFFKSSSFGKLNYILSFSPTVDCLLLQPNTAHWVGRMIYNGCHNPAACILCRTEVD